MNNKLKFSMLLNMAHTEKLILDLDFEIEHALDGVERNVIGFKSKRFGTSRNDDTTLNSVESDNIQGSRDDGVRVGETEFNFDHDEEVDDDDVENDNNLIDSELPVYALTMLEDFIACHFTSDFTD